MAMRLRIALLLSVMLTVCLPGCGLQSREPQMTASILPATLLTSSHIPSSPKLNLSPSPLISACVTALPSALPFTQAPILLTDQPENERKKYAAWGLTDKQFFNINLLICSAYQMKRFSSLQSLQPSDYLQFVLNIYNDYLYTLDSPAVDDTENCYIVPKARVEGILSSAFGVRYQTSYKGNRESGIYFKNGKYHIQDDGPVGTRWSYAYRISQVSNAQYEVYADIITSGEDGDGFCYSGAIKVAVQQDAASIFGFRLLSCADVNKAYPRFDVVSASSFIPSFAPRNAVDHDGMESAWKATGKNPWLLLSAQTEQTVSGLILHASMDSSNGDCAVQITLSDGSTYISCILNGVLSFGRLIKTSGIRLTFINGNDGEPVEVTDIVPF